MKRLLLSLLFVSPLSAEVSLTDAIQEVRPGAVWNLRGDTYEGLEWLDNVFTKPSKAELDAAKTKLEKAEPMPTLQEQVDALLQGGAAETQMKARILRAKNKEPKL